MEEVFRTAQGVSAPCARGLCSGYREEGREGETVFTVSLTAPRQEELLRRFCGDRPVIRASCRQPASSRPPSHPLR